MTNRTLPISMRLTAKQRRKLGDAAALNGRTLTAEIEARLLRSLDGLDDPAAALRAQADFYRERGLMLADLGVW